MITIDIHALRPDGTPDPQPTTTLDDTGITAYTSTIKESLEYYSTARTDIAQGGALSFTVTNRQPYDGAFTPGQNIFRHGTRGGVARLKLNGETLHIGVIATAKENYKTSEFGTVEITTRSMTETLGRSVIGDIAEQSERTVDQVLERIIERDQYSSFFSGNEVTGRDFIEFAALRPELSVADAFGGWLALAKVVVNITGTGKIRYRKSIGASLWRAVNLLGDVRREFHDQTAYNVAEYRYHNPDDIAQPITETVSSPLGFARSRRIERKVTLDLRLFSRQQAVALSTAYIQDRAVPRFRTAITLPNLPRVGLNDVVIVEWGTGKVPGPVLPGGGYVVAGRVIERSVDLVRDTQSLTLEDVHLHDDNLPQELTLGTVQGDNILTNITPIDERGTII